MLAVDNPPPQILDQAAKDHIGQVLSTLAFSYSHYQYTNAHMFTYSFTTLSMFIYYF